MKSAVPLVHIAGTTLFLIAVAVGWHIGMSVFAR